MARRSPRIPDEDYLTADDLLMGAHEGEWIRTAAYKDGHQLSRDGATALCGRPLAVSESHWDDFSSAFERIFGEELSPYYMALDTRKGSKCAKCRSTTVDRFDLVDPMGDDKPEPVSTEREDKFTPHETTSADRLQQARFRSKVAMVMREFAATTVS